MIDRSSGHATDDSSRTDVLSTIFDHEPGHFMSKLTRTLLVPLVALCFAGLFTTSAVQAQSVDVGGTLASRYVWRGTDFGNAAAIQPSLSFSQGGFTIGAWGSFALSPGTGATEVTDSQGDITGVTAVPESGVNENDLYASYTFDTGGSGSVSVFVTDFYFSTPGADFFDYDGDTGSHVIEPGVSYSGPESLPISLHASINAYGRGAVDGNEIWLEASYPFSVNEVDLSIAVGGTPNDNATDEGASGNYYGTDADTDAGITKLSLSASKSIEITDEFSLPISASYYINPYTPRSYFIFGISL